MLRWVIQVSLVGLVVYQFVYGERSYISGMFAGVVLALLLWSISDEARGER